MLSGLAGLVLGASWAQHVAVRVSFVGKAEDYQRYSVDVRTLAALDIPQAVDVQSRQMSGRGAKASHGSEGSHSEAIASDSNSEV